jgi:hypothetical protein
MVLLLRKDQGRYMDRLTRMILFCAIICLFQGCAPAKQAPSLTAAEENTYIGPNSNIDYIYRGPPAAFRGR